MIRGIGISTKLILSSTLLICLVVTAVGALAVHDSGVLYDAMIAQTVTVQRSALETKGKAVASMVARAVELAPEEVGGTEIQASLERTLASDRNLEIAAVFDRRKDLIAVLSQDERLRPRDLDFLASRGSVAANKMIEERPPGSNAAVPGAGIELDSDAFRDIAIFIHPVSRAPGEENLADSGESATGFVAIGYEQASVEALDAGSVVRRSRARKQTMQRTVIVGGLCAVIGIVLAIFQGLSLSRPLKILAWRADQLARGDLAARVQIRRNDEVGVLGRSFNELAERLAEILKLAQANSAVEKEIEVARQIQESLVPGPEPALLPGLSIAGFMESASECGGDFWTFREIGGGRVLIVVGDVTGHGVGSAMITATAKAAIDVALDLHEELSPSQLLSIMNSAVLESAKRRFVMTCFASIVDVRSHTVTSANAGHNFPYLCRKRADGSWKLENITVRGNRLGDLETSSFEPVTSSVGSGDFLVWYSDGIVECESPDGVEYGEKRFRTSIVSAASLDPAEARDRVIADATAFYDGIAHKDDMTLVVARIG